MNRISPEIAAAEDCPLVKEREALRERCQEFLTDESRLRAEGVDVVYQPQTTAEVVAAVKELRSSGQTCVVSGARTGIAGGAVPLGADAVISTMRMNRVLGMSRSGEDHVLRLQPGVTLAEIETLLRSRNLGDLSAATPEETRCMEEWMKQGPDLWFPVDPTETSAHIGGAVMTNASGARTFRYGVTREWVVGMSLVLADGRVLRVKRGEVSADDNTFVWVDADGHEKALVLPTLPVPETKATLGYAAQTGMDLVDLFVGSEGTLGVLVEIELRLALRPASQLGVLAILESEARALDFVENIRQTDGLSPDAIEYFGPRALALLREKKEADGTASEIPELPSWEGAAVYLELSGTEEETEAQCEPLEGLLAEVGSSLDQTWAAMEPAELAQQKHFRHALPEAVNGIIGQRQATVPGLHKVGTDMAVPDKALREIVATYRAGLAESGLDAVIFGHIGDNHVHVNIRPRDQAELNRAKALYLAWAEEVVRLGGAVAAEHGIGRIKKGMLEVQYSADILEGMRTLRRVLDPTGCFGPGVLV